MKFAKKCLSSILVCYILIFSGCSSIETYVPNPLVDNVASWDQNEQNSGLIDYIDGEGFLLTQGAANRYKALTEQYGESHTPPLKRGEGLKKRGDYFILPNEYMVEFIVMSRRHKRTIQNKSKSIFKLDI